MSYDDWQRPWSERGEYRPQRRTRVVREVRPREFFFATILVICLIVLAVAWTIDSVNVWIDVLRHGQKSKVTIDGVNHATVGVVLGPVAVLLFLWLGKRVVQNWWWSLTAPADTIYIKRRY